MEDTKSFLSACQSGDLRQLETVMSRVDVNTQDADGMSGLMLACRKGRSGVVTRLLSVKSVDVNLSDTNGRQAIHWACESGKLTVVSALLEVGVDIVTKDGKGSTPLIFASKRFSEVVDFLIRKGAKVNVVNDLGNTALHFACRLSTDDSPEVLIAHGAGTNVQNNDGQTPLHLCMSNKLADHCAVLLRHGACVDIQDKDGWSPLVLACDKGRLDSCRVLIQHGACVNTQTNEGITPLFQASVGGHEDLCKPLIDKGASVDLPNKSGHTALMTASDKGNVGVCRVLIKGGASVNKQAKSGRDALHYAANNGRDECCRLLLQTEAEVDLRSNARETPLLLACYGGHLECCKSLVEFKANVDAVSATGVAPVYYTCLRGHKECLSFLLASGASVNIPTVSGCMAIHAASLEGHVECLRLLLDNGAYVNCRGESIGTPLCCACQEGHVRCVELLLEKGADPSLSRPGHKNRPIDIARSKGHLDIVSKLETAVSLSEKSPKLPFEKLMNFFSKEECKEASKQECEYARTCRVYKKSLNLKEPNFDSTYDVCFCESCHSKRGHSMYYARGEPPKDYGIPIGWVKFGLVATANAVREEAFRKWHVAFHGTRVGCVKQIIETGDLTYDDNSGMAPPSGYDVSKIYLSQSIRYSGLEVYAPSHTYIDPITEIIQRARLAFQVRIKPGTYDVGAQTIGASGQIDPKFPNSALEWSTKSRGVTILVGLLVKVDGLKEGPSLTDPSSLGPTLPQNMGM